MATTTATAARATSQARQSWAPPAARAAIVLAALGLSGAVLQAGAAGWLGRSDPAGAAQVAPQNARLAMAAAQAAAEKGASVRAAQVRQWVKTALARDLTVPSAIEFRGLAADETGDHQQAGRLFELSSAISRRSLPTRLWLIQRSVDRGDVAGALEDFDLALRTSSNAPNVLFPVLARASADPDLAGPIARVLDRRSDWRAEFLNYAISEAHAGAGVSAVVLRMRDRRAITDDHIDGALVGELVSEQEFALARRVHDSFRPAPARRTLVNDPQFSDPAAESPFGWDLSEKGEAGAERSLVDGRPALAYQSSPGGAGQVATQLLTLAPGGYRLSTQTATPASDAAARPYWSVTCAQGGGGQVALLDQPTAAAASGSVEFTVPPDCTAQWLALNLRASDGPNQAGAIASVAIEPRAGPKPR